MLNGLPETMLLPFLVQSWHQLLKFQYVDCGDDFRKLVLSANNICFKFNSFYTNRNTIDDFKILRKVLTLGGEYLTQSVKKHVSVEFFYFSEKKSFNVFCEVYLTYSSVYFTDLL